MKDLLIAISHHSLRTDGSPADATYLMQLVAALRPPRGKGPSGAIQQVHNLLAYLRSYPELCEGLRTYLLDVVANRSPVRLLTDSGVLANTGLFGELGDRLGNRLLPPVPDNAELVSLVHQVFNRRSDAQWVAAVPIDLWVELFTQLDLRRHLTPAHRLSFRTGLINAVVVLSHRITAIGLEPEIVAKLPELDDLQSPFLAQNDELVRYTQYLRTADPLPPPHTEDHRHVLVLLQQCEAALAYLRKNRQKYGASLRLTHLMRRMSQQISRLRRLIYLAHHLDDKTAYRQLADFMQQIVEDETHRYSLRRVFTQNADLLAAQVVEHAGRTGEHYITTTRPEYAAMFRSAMLGGVVVAFLSLFKNLLYYLKLAPFGQALVYSLNYAAGFIGIYMLHGTLATKQPAMTASRLAAALDAGSAPAGAPPSGGGNLPELAFLIVRTLRTQFIAFVGNLALAFPVATVLAFGFYFIFGRDVVDADKAHHLLHDLDPVSSLALFHAAIAGVFLYLSGLISGYTDNRVIYSRFGDRLRHHRLTLRLLGPTRTDRLAHYLEHSLGSLMGNLIFGFLLGYTAAVGAFFGLPLDIRHITFAAANLGVAGVSLGFDIPLEVWLMSILGIVGIGFFNFAVSFGLALFTAIQARGVRFSQTPTLLLLLLSILRRHPLDFLYPPAQARIPAEFFADYDLRTGKRKPA